MKKEVKTPERMCVACRQMKPKTELVRIVFQKETGKAFVDVSGKANGRGVYVCKCKQCLERLKKNKGFCKAHGFSLSDEICGELEKLIG